MNKYMLDLFRAHTRGIVPDYMIQRWCDSHNPTPCEGTPLSDMSEYVEAREIRQSIVLMCSVACIVGIGLCYLGHVLQSSLFINLSAAIVGVSCLAILVAGVALVTLKVPPSWRQYASDFDAFMVNFEISDFSIFQRWPFPQGLQAYVDAKFMDTKVQISLQRNALLHRWAHCFAFAEPWDVHVKKFKPDYL